MGFQLQDAPPVVFGATSTRDLPGYWAVGITHPGFEWRFVERVVSGAVPGIGFFLPHTKVRNPKRRHYHFEPLYPRYVFLRGDAVAIAECKPATRCISEIIAVNDQKRLSSELEAVEAAMRAGAEFRREHFKRGVRVQVATGPFMGIQGIVAGEAPHLRLVLNISILGDSRSIEISPDVLELLN